MIVEKKTALRKWGCDNGLSPSGKEQEYGGIELREVWKPLIYNGLDLTDRLLISDQGEIYSLNTNKKLKQCINKRTGYYGVCISLGSRKRRKLIKPHIAVACMFVDGREEGLVVNHKDGNKKNNCADNLEWCTQKENSKHALENGLIKRAKKIKCIETGETFNSIKDAGKWCGMTKKSGSLCEYFNNPKRKTSGKHPVTGESLTWELL